MGSSAFIYIPRMNAWNKIGIPLYYFILGDCGLVVAPCSLTPNPKLSYA